MITKSNLRSLNKRIIKKSYFKYRTFSGDVFYLPSMMYEKQIFNYCNEKAYYLGRYILTNPKLIKCQKGIYKEYRG